MDLPQTLAVRQKPAVVELDRHQPCALVQHRQMSVALADLVVLESHLHAVLDPGTPVVGVLVPRRCQKHAASDRRPVVKLVCLVHW